MLLCLRNQLISKLPEQDDLFGRGPKTGARQRASKVCFVLLTKIRLIILAQGPRFTLLALAHTHTLTLRLFNVRTVILLRGEREDRFLRKNGYSLIRIKGSSHKKIVKEASV